MKYTYLHWDSLHFGYKVSCINAGIRDEYELNATLNELIKRDYTLAYLFLHPDDKLNASAKRLKGIHVDEKVTYQKVISETQDPDFGETGIFNYNKSFPLGKIIDLAMESGIYSRFKRDPNFKNNEFEILYKNWILNSIKKKTAFEVLLYIDNNLPAGLVTLGNKKGTGDIGLVAVDKNYQGKGIGTALIKTAEKVFRQNSIFSFQVVTQKQNITACRLYEKCGCKEISVFNVYHFWLQ